MGEKITIEIPANLNFVPGIRSCLARIAQNFGFNEYETYHIETIVDELTNNAIEHGSKDERQIVVLECIFESGQLELTIKDSGYKEFKADKIFEDNKRRIEEGWPIEEMEQRGRGLFIIQKLVDELTIITSSKGTEISLVKKHREFEGEREFSYPKIIKEN